MSNSLNAIQLGVIYIKNDNLAGLEKVLNILPLDKLGKQGDTLLSTYLSLCANYNKIKASDMILDAWKVVYPEDEAIQLKSKLFMIQEINLPTLAFISFAHNDYSYMELFDDLILDDSSPEVVQACAKADKIFGPQTYEIYKKIKDMAIEGKNQKVQEFMMVNMSETSPFAPVPDWIKNFTKTNLVVEKDIKIPEIDSIKIKLPSDEEAVELLTRGLKENGIDLGEETRIKEFLLEKLKTSSEDVKLQLLKPILDTAGQLRLAYNVDLFRLFGPSNPLIGQDLTLHNTDKPSYKYGGCRMFLCDVFDYNQEEDYLEDWFDGSCDQCFNRIKKQHYAVRKPRTHGGWFGCFCSWMCVKQSLIDEGAEDETKIDVVAMNLINEFERSVSEIGIQDRL